MKVKMKCVGLNLIEGDSKNPPRKSVHLHRNLPEREQPETAANTPAPMIGEYLTVIENPGSDTEFEIGREYVVEVTPGPTAE